MQETKNLAFESANALPDQILQAWRESSQIEFPDAYRKAKNIVISGMGASGLPGHIVTSVFQAKVPIVLTNDYSIPFWANNETLVFLSSYSGNTEETISCFEEAKRKGCLVTGATTGGELARLLEAEDAPFYKYDPKHNPSGQPRIGLGYGIFGQVGILYKLGVLDGSDGLEHEVAGFVEALKGSRSALDTASQNLAKQLQGSVILVLAGEHLAGNAHAFANQLNETAKNLAGYYSLPEANHHLLEGLKNPKVPLITVFLNSKNYSEQIKKRLEFTKEVIEKNGYKTYVYKPKAYVYKPTVNGRLGEVMELLLLSSFTTAYLAEIYGENPLEIPWVDYFKRKLQEAAT